MKTRLLDHSLILATVLLTVYGQMIIKWRVGQFGAIPGPTSDKLSYFAGLLIDPGVLSGLAAAFLAAVAWMAVMSKFDLSYAYPFISLNFVIVVVLSCLAFHEALTPPKLIGVTLIVLGTIVASRG
jgi:uncharacterized membrane protein